MKCTLNIFIFKTVLFSIIIFPNITAFSLESQKSFKNITEYSHRYWDFRNGFSHYSINTILQTRDGYIWIGTDEGLVRFDGAEFSTFNNSNTKAFKTNAISSLAEDKNGRLWIGCINGGLLSYFENSFTNYFIVDSLSDDRVNSLCVDKANNLWIGTKSNLSYVSLNEIKKAAPGEQYILNNIIDIDFNIFNVISIVCDSSGTVWVLCNANSYIYKINPEKKEKNILYSNTYWDSQINCFLSESKGRNWIGTFYGLKVIKDHNLCLYSAKNGSIDFRITALIEDRSGNLWIGTHGNGLYMLDTAGYLQKFFVKEGITVERVMTLFEDSDGGIWIGTRGGGLHRLQKKIVKTYTVSDGLSDNCIWSIIQKRNNDIWIGTNKGLNKLSIGKYGEIITKLSIPGDEKDNIVRTIIEDDNDILWVGTGKNILKYFDRKFERYLSVSGTKCLVIDSNKYLWVGGVVEGLIRVQKGSYQKYFQRPLNITRPGKEYLFSQLNQIKALCLDNAGNLWIGTNSGLFQNIDDSLLYFDKVPGLTGNGVMTLYNDSKGILWITVYNFGLFRFDPTNIEKQFTHITTNNGLIDNTIYSILEDDYGRFWFGSNKGIFSVNRQELVDFCEGKTQSVHSVSYGIHDGMENIECNGGNHPSALKSSDGRLWFPTMGGVAVIDPGNVNKEENISKIYIQKINVDGIEISTNQVHLLEPGNKRKIEFRYTAINFSDPENVRFKYRLEGYDNDWIDAQNHRAVFYLNVPPGRYTFHAITQNNKGAWNSEGDSVSFEIPPHFWETGIFKILLAVFLLALVIGTTRFVYSRKLKRQLYELEKQQALAQERLRISRDIHDEIGSRLTKISVLSESVIEEIEETNPVQEFTEKISNETKEVIENLDEIIWFINPGNDTVELLGSYLREYLKDYFNSTDIECFCDFPDSYSVQPISPEIRRNTVLTLKEIANNIVKHASATKVCVKFQLQEQGLIFSVKDNGEGFNTQAAFPLGNGLINMQKRIEEIGGKIIIKSVLFSGTEIQIFIPLTNT